MGHENSGADQTHYCRHCRKHCQGSFAPLRDRERRPPCTVKKISGHKHTIPIDEDFAQQCIVVFVIPRQEFGILRPAA
jgi:hypothetical protein